MIIQALVEHRPNIGIEFSLAKRRGGPAIILGEPERLETDANFALIARLPLEPEDRARAIHFINEDARMFWGVKVVSS